MAYKNRYIFIKRCYPNTIVIFKNNKSYTSYDEDKEFLNYLNFKKLNNLNKLKINYIVIDNMKVIQYVEFKNNNYKLYYKRFILFKLIKYINYKIKK